MTVVGLATMLYPTAASWFTSQAQAASIDAYATEAKHLPEGTKRELLQRAREYNKSLPVGMLRDPYSEQNGKEPGASGDAVTEDYLGQLRVPGTDTLAQLSIPDINVNIPVYHGTSAKTLDRGAGHLLGSSLPVGGQGSHSAITAHSGLPHARMFTSLPRLKVNDTFTVTVLDEKMSYRVDQIKTVTPDSIGELDIVPDKEYMTLITCTPINVNTHRLLVRGVRIPDAEAQAQHITAPAGAGFPWWIPVLIGVPSVVAAVLYAPARGSLGTRRQFSNWPQNSRK